jgi:hypothetical protein
MKKKVTGLPLLFFPAHFYSFFYFNFYFSPTPNPLLNAFKPIPLRWVAFYLSSRKNKRPMERSPWVSCFSLYTTTFFTALKPTFLLSGGCQSAGARTVPFSYSSFTYSLFGSACFKTE